jgi:hypothetical protein
LAVIRARTLAAQTDMIFQHISMAKTATKSEGIQLDYSFKIDLNELGRPTAYTITDAKPEDQDAINSHLKTLMEASMAGAKGSNAQAARKPFSDALAEYFDKAQIKPQSKATYRSRLDHAQKFFGASEDALGIDQAGLVKYCDHVKSTVPNITTQGHYISTVASFLNWHRHRVSGLPALTLRTLLPRKDTPESEERDAFTLDQLRLIFANARTYADTCPHKFWISVAPAFLGCRIEELCQVHLDTDLAKDEEAGIWYLVFDGRADPDGVTRKSMKKVSSWRRVPVHSALVRHGFIDFLLGQRQAGFERPFQKEWKPREVESELGRIIKWSHYISRWGGRELIALAERHQFDLANQSYFHSMRHSFKGILGDAGVSTEISEALAGRRYAGADAERYEKLKQNHRRLSEGIERGLDTLSTMLDDILGTRGRTS